MDILYLLIPLSALLVLAIIGVFGWALYRGQFEDLDHEGERILQDDAPDLAAPDVDPSPAPSRAPGAADPGGGDAAERAATPPAVSPASEDRRGGPPRA